MNQRPYEPRDAIIGLNEVIEGMKSLNESAVSGEGARDYRCRELSIAITEAETAKLWAIHAFRLKGVSL